MDIVFKIRKAFVKWVTLGSPLLAIAIIYFFDFRPLNFFRYILNPDFFKTIKQSNTELVINQVFVTFLINLFLELFRNLGDFSLKVINNDRKSTTYIPLGMTQRPKKIFIELKVNYRNELLKYCFKKLGGLNLYIWIPHWVSMTIANEDNFEKGTIDNTTSIKYISVSLEKAIGYKEVEGDIYLNATILSGATSFIEGNINSQIRPATKNPFQKALCYFLIFWCFELENNKHKLISSRG
ncbi:hypothetical protein [Bacillus paranthracis]|uniref:hypothetical protein n=1 Tax=Bacillus paranthracis TaxID=2026186 RepID=UPI000B44C0C0|nr:hypothetical protein [Bacillus thuringiensis]MCU5340770.1 hypothetical protein [Bacillus cereus]MCX3321559.1 hypothetical protein [Bacillus paranthracis]MBH0350631.1 hypothetical protein [Bacillus thuringiensis]OTX99387.1 hypothetical protein BK731_30295 [Bacillus thuringiensis serovar muju]HDR4582819.1 hypothetical protein [Bacillus cereus]